MPGLATAFGRAPHAGAWTPASLPSLAGWYDASDTASITSSGGKVSQWNDLSGAGNHVVQATGASQPPTGSDTLNIKNVLGPWGSENSLQKASTTFSMKPTALTCLAVFKAPPDFGSDGRVIITGDTSASTVMFRISSAGKLQVVQPRLAVLFTGTATLSVSTAYIAGFTMTSGTPGNFSTFLNSPTAEASGTHDFSSGAAGLFCIGSHPTVNGYSWLAGDMAELVICSSVLGSSDLTSGFSYLDAKWAVY